MKGSFGKVWQARAQEMVAVVAGLMILIGVVLLGFALLSSSGFLDVGLMLEEKYLLAFALLAVVGGLFDVFAAIVIARW